MFGMDQSIDFLFDNDDRSNDNVHCTNTASGKRIFHDFTAQDEALFTSISAKMEIFEGRVVTNVSDKERVVHDFRAQDDAFFASMSSQMKIFDRRVVTNISACEHGLDGESGPEDVDPEDQVYHDISGEPQFANEEREIFNYNQILDKDFGEDRYDFESSGIYDQLIDHNVRSELASPTVSDHSIPSGVVESHQVEETTINESFNDSYSDGSARIDTICSPSGKAGVSVENELSGHQTLITSVSTSNFGAIKAPKLQIEPYHRHINGKGAITFWNGISQSYSRRIFIKSIRDEIGKSEHSVIYLTEIPISHFRLRTLGLSHQIQVSQDASEPQSGYPLKVIEMRVEYNETPSDTAILQCPSRPEHCVQILQRIDPVIHHLMHYWLTPSDSVKESSAINFVDGRSRGVPGLTNSTVFTPPG